MRRAIFLALLVFASGVCFADVTAEGTETPETDASNLLIPEESIFTDAYGQLNISPYSSIPRWGAFLINYAVGFGIGSFLQGDKAGGKRGLVLDILGFGLMGVGLLTALAPEPPLPGFFIRVTATGAIVGFVSKIYQMIRPWVYDDSSGIAVASTIDGNGKLAVSAKWVYRY